MYGSQLVGYLHAREEEGMGASVPLAISKAIAWFEKIGGFDEEVKISNDPLLQLVVKGMLKRLEDKTPPRKRAPRLLSCFLPAMERLVTARDEPVHIRLGAWVKLLKVWASFRFDDLAHLRVDTVRFYDARLSGLMRRTKTTGAGKRVRDLPFHIGTDAWIDDSSWLGAGWEIARGAVLKGDLLIPAGSSGPQVEDDMVMSYTEAVAWSMEVFTAMKGPDGKPLVPEDWERFWTEHSERSTLSSGLASLGIQKSDRDLLGRWTPEGSDQRIRTYNSVVSGLQAKFAGPVRRGDGYDAFDEGSVLEELKVWLHEKWGVEESTAEEAVENWKTSLRPVKGGFMEMVSKDGDGGVQEGSQPKGEVAPDSSSSSSSTEEESSSGRKGIERLSEEREFGFVVVYNRIDRGKLHRGGKKGCWMAKQRKFRKATSFAKIPDESEYTSRCKLCWPEKGADESSSDSEDELIDDEPDESELAGFPQFPDYPIGVEFDAWT